MRDQYIPAPDYFTDRVSRRTVVGLVTVASSFLAACGSPEKQQAEYVEFGSITYPYKLMRPSQWNYSRIESPGLTMDAFENTENKGMTNVTISIPLALAHSNIREGFERVKENLPKMWQMHGYQATTKVITQPDNPSQEWGTVDGYAPYIVATTIRGPRQTGTREQYNVLLEREGDIWVIVLDTQGMNIKSDITQFKKMLNSFRFLPR